MMRGIACVLVASLVCAVAEAAELQVDIEGIEGELLENARAALELAVYEERDVSPAQIRLMYQSAPEQIRAALRPYGYYNASVASDLTEVEPGEFRATFEVDAGEPVVVTDVHVAVNGPGGEIPKVEAALRQFQPQVGERLDHSVYENSKEQVSSALRTTGFLDAETIRSRIEVVPATNSARIELVWNSGERYRFGPVHFSESPLRERFLQGYVPWQQGDPYSSDAILLLQRRLTETEYFDVVSIRPQLRQARNREVPIEAVLVPNQRNLYMAGLYWNTDTGPGGRVGFERRWLNARGHKAEASLEYSQRLQDASANYVIPQPGPYRRDYSLGAAYRDEETDSSRARMTSIAAAESRENWHGFIRTLGIQYLQSDFEIAAERRRSDMVYADAALTRRIVDDVMYPRDSYAVTLALRGAPGALSDTDFVQLHMQGKWVRGVGPDQRIMLRGELGAMTVGDFDALPPRLRFFAGGDRSIRGFDYEAIGERRGDDGVIGGKYVAVAGAEYDYFFFGDWGAAAFVDAGDAFTSDFDMHMGAGVGVRWRSPVGMIRLDFARAIEGSLGEGWRVHLVIGPDL